jgi:hypothetical protein
VAALALVAACGDDAGSGRDTAGDGTDSIAPPDEENEGETTSSGTTGDGDGDPSGDGDGEPSGDGDGEPSGDGDGEPSGDGDGEPSGDGDGDGDPCGGGGDSPVEKLIWIANSGQGTVSKIDTETGVELGRYIVRPDSAGSPSRTSVNRFGDVAVANRNGGVTKVAGALANCVESNGIPGIQTSQGPTDILPWGQDECVQWHTTIPHIDNRPIAWTNGTFNQATCEWEDVHVWTAWSDVTPGSAVVALLDGATGAILQEVPIPSLPSPWPGWHGFYGAAVDGNNNVWLGQLQGSNPQAAWLVRVNFADFQHTGFPVPGDGGYGMTVTSEGYVWLCGLQTRRFDPQTQTWDSVPLLGGSVHTGGCMGDGNGTLYRGGYAQVHGIDTETMQVVNTLDVGQGGDDFIWGVAIDFDGYVWGVPRNGSRAYKVDPDTNQIVHTVDGLVQAYTYSDMTGFALVSVEPG